jgi:YVTN family beta-propeller protein
MKTIVGGVWLVAMSLSCLAQDYYVCVSNEKAGTISLVDVRSQIVETVSVGKRPRGIRASPDGRFLFVAVSGSPIKSPPKLDARGNPVFQDNDDDEKNSDHSADGIAVVDVAQRRFIRKIDVGSDPEQFAVGADGKHICVSNEDVGKASWISAETGKIEHVMDVKKEPEGVAFSPDGKTVWVTCETRGEVFVFDTTDFKQLAEIKVGGRPRNVAFLPDGSRAFVPSESTGRITAVDVGTFAIQETIDLPKGSRPMDLAVSKDVQHLYVTCGRAGTVCDLDPQTLEVRKVIKAGARPWGLALSPDQKKAFVANGPSNDISIIDLEAAKEIARVKVGESPWGIAVIEKKAAEF